MLRQKLFGLAAYMALATPGFGQGDPEFQKLAPAVQTAVDRGALLYVYDEAAWQGTDDIRDNFPQLLGQASGYVASGSQAETDLVFFDEASATAVYRARFQYGKLVWSGPPASGRAALTPLERQMAAARTKAIDAFTRAKVRLCSKADPNFVTLPPETDGGPVIVYVMTPRTSLDSLPLGGHYSVEVRIDGTVGKVRPYTTACAELSLLGPDNNPVEALTITHLLDPTPTEIHVFSSMTGRVPIFVGTSNQRLWAVEGNHIRSVEVPKEK